tara:strand:- start:532 stop:1173 length:642 start_codon:yes stop_codon:yes gene_type:complete
MGFLFFGKKRSEKDEAVEHINQISENLKKSFIRIKTDIKLVRDWLSFFKTKDGEYENRFKDIESRIDEMGEVIAYLADKDQTASRTPQRPEKAKEAPYYGTEETHPLPKMKRSFLDDLTETQRAMFLRLGAFQRESGQEWTSLKTLAQDIYPGKTYDKVRSTVSEYIGILVDAGLIAKTRKGKQTYITITEKGQQYFKKNDKKAPKKQVQKAK